MTKNGAYAQAGVNITAGTEATKLMAEAVRSTYGKEVLAGIGAFGGVFDVSVLKNMDKPVLVASTDGVGTKTRVAARMNRWDSIGHDLVNHCVNDILVQGAHPLFFLDYVAASHIDPQQVATIVSGVAAGCREAGCALLGGETAEMPRVYQPGEIDLAGTIIGTADQSEIITGKNIRADDAIIGLPSSGLHTNGYSLAYRVLENLDWSEPVTESGSSVGEALLAVHRSYLPQIQQLRAAGITVNGLAHITGGGFEDNLPRIFPEGVSAVLWKNAWPVTPIFNLIQRLGQIDDAEMFHVFNMGLGMLVVVPAEQSNRVLTILPGDAYRVGEIVPGNGTVFIEVQG